MNMRSMSLAPEKLQQLVQILLDRHTEPDFGDSMRSYLLCIKEFEDENNAKVTGILSSAGWSTRGIDFETGEDELVFRLKYGI